MDSDPEVPPYLKVEELKEESSSLSLFILNDSKKAKSS